MMQRKRHANKQHAMTLRMTPHLRAKCLKAAEERGMLLTQFIRHAAAVVAEGAAVYRSTRAA
jgi:uncharacterized protein (DUF1778 family)